MKDGDRRRALEARVYGRDPDPAAVAELRELLGPVLPEPVPVPRPSVRPSRVRLVGAAVLAAVLLASAAWGIGAVGGRSSAVARPTPVASAHPITVFTSSGSGTTTVVDASTGRVLTQTGPLPSCSPTMSEHPTDPICRAAAAFSEAGVARAQHAAVAARARR